MNFPAFILLLIERFWALGLPWQACICAGVAIGVALGFIKLTGV